ncbi:MAG: hypothetical protein ACM3ZV_06115 [Bacillota bacterium]
MTAFLRHLLLLAVLTALGFAMFVLLFWAGAGASVTILFYRGVILALAAAILTGAAAFWLTRGTGESSLPVAAAALSLSFNICFLVLLPVTVDRSVSVYLLSTIERRQAAGIAPSDLEQAFVDGYVVKMGAVDRRIDEQRRSGNITVGADGKVRLTRQGRRFMDLSRLVARLFGTDSRFVAQPPPSSDRKLSKHN